MITDSFDSITSPLVLFGGTFDPIHNGHLAIANFLYSKFNTKITFLPTRTPPYKSPSETSNLERLEMLTLALNDPRYILNTFEIKQNEYWYSHKTLTFIRNNFGLELPIFFLIGGDSLITLDSWDYWQKLFDLTNFIIVNRPGYKYNSMAKELQNEFDSRKTTDFSDLNSSYGKIYLLDFPPTDISSTEVRRLIKIHSNIDQLVPQKVATYIHQHKIYRKTNGHKTSHTNCN